MNETKPTNIYVVRGMTGKWDDATEWPVRAFTTETEATDHRMELLEERDGVLGYVRSLLKRDEGHTHCNTCTCAVDEPRAEEYGSRNPSFDCKIDLTSEGKALNKLDTHHRFDGDTTYFVEVVPFGDEP